MNDENLELPDSYSEANYSIRVDDYLHRKLEKHLKILKFVEHQKYSKQQWIIEALKEKLQNKIDLAKDEVPKDKRIVFRINEHLNEEISKQVDIHKKFRTSYSKKQWFVEAIHEKLEREEEKARQFLNKFRNP